MTPTIRIPDNWSKHAVTLSVCTAAGLVAFVFGAGWQLRGVQVLAQEVQSRVVAVEEKASRLEGKYARIVEENVLPPALEQRLKGIESALVRIESNLEGRGAKSFRVPESSSAAFQLPQGN